MRILPLSALLLVACSAEPAADGAAATGTPTPAPSALIPVAAPAATAIAPPAPVPGELATFGDWTVGCDNTLTCTMASLGTDSGEFPPVTLAVTRRPGPGGGWELAFETSGDRSAIRPVAALVDGRRVALPGLDGTPAAALVAAMANGRRLDPVERGEVRRESLSLHGASAALRRIDALQGRAGTVTAAVAKGDRPAATVPPGRPAPTVEALAATGTPATPNAAQLGAMRRSAACDGAPAGAEAMWQSEAHALGGGATLVLLPCSTGAYNLSFALFILRDGRVEPARVDAPTGFDPAPATGADRPASIVNGAWQNGELSGFARARGLGDCGTRQTFVWDGTRLRLSEQSMMSECRGNPHFITTWRTHVVRR